MRHPVPYAVVGQPRRWRLLAIPFFHLNLGLSDDRVGPKNMSSRVATDQIRENFASREADALPVQIPNVDPKADRERDRPVRPHALGRAGRRARRRDHRLLPRRGRQDDPYSLRASELPLADGSLPSRASAARSSPSSPTSSRCRRRARSSCKHVRATPAPFAFLVAGPSAQLVDTKHTVIERLPIALGLIALGDVRAAVHDDRQHLRADQGAALEHAEPHRDVRRDGVDLPGRSSLAACSTSRRPAASTCSRPILMFCIAFGLSMDYEVFLLSRIKEEYDLEHDNERAVAVGLQKTGRIVTAAALLLTIVFIGIATSEVALVKAFGVGLTLRRPRRRVPHPRHARARVHATRRSRSTGGRRGGCAGGTCASASGRTNRSRCSTVSSRRPSVKPPKRVIASRSRTVRCRTGRG